MESWKGARREVLKDSMIAFCHAGIVVDEVSFNDLGDLRGRVPTPGWYAQRGTTRESSAATRSRRE